MERSTVVRLKQETEDFFARHWNESVLEAPAPNWREIPSSFSGSVPYYDKGGCYALAEGDIIVYVGIGASKGYDPYIEHGISRRLLFHVIKPIGNDHYVPKDRWKNITTILTIGFEKQLKYVAPALEDYLIWKLSPRENRSKKRVKPRLTTG